MRHGTFTSYVRDRSFESWSWTEHDSCCMSWQCQLGTLLSRWLKYSSRYDYGNFKPSYPTPDWFKIWSCSTFSVNEKQWGTRRSNKSKWNLVCRRKSDFLLIWPWSPWLEKSFYSLWKFNFTIHYFHVI